MEYGMHWLFVVNEGVIKCFPLQMKSKVVRLVSHMHGRNIFEMYLRGAAFCGDSKTCE